VISDSRLVFAVIPGALASSWRCQSPLCTLSRTPLTTRSGLVEPGGNALRSVWGAQLSIDDRRSCSAGNDGLLVAMFAKAAGRSTSHGTFATVTRIRADARFRRCLDRRGSPEPSVDAVIDATNSPTEPARALELVEPAGESCTSGSRVAQVSLTTGRWPQGRNGGRHTQRISGLVAP